MNKERWAQVRDLLHELMEQDASQRAITLDRVGADDADLRREAESLLRFEDENLLEQTARAAAGLAPEFARSFPERIGSYRLLKEIGRGGMGVVYQAERDDGHFSKQVALKLLPAVYSQTELESRFLRERQILARLEHPHIARLLDGGVTSDARPYLVMELVEGIPLTEWAKSQAPSLAARLRLFLDVCSAVASAHRSLVVHRDLKPGNILVTPEGQVKLLDFGLARMLESASDNTSALPPSTMQMMTPAYASPEQIQNDPITVASDVFSLGVVLYELLTGTRPFGSSGDTAAKVQRAVCESDPVLPSQAVAAPELRRKLAGDLDNIVLKAMEKSPAQRYSSVDDLAADLTRYLVGRPVQARNAGVAYRAAKFLQRNRILVGVVSVAVVAILAGLAFALREARLAQQHFNDVRRLAHAVLFDLHDAIAPLPGSTKARELLVKQGLEYLDALARQTKGDPQLRSEVADGYVRLANVEGTPGAANLGNVAGAISSLEKAQALLEEAYAESPQDHPTALRLASVYRDLAILHGNASHLDQQGRLLDQARALSLKDSAAHPNDVQARRNAASNEFALASLRINEHHYDQALVLLHSALNAYSLDLAADPSSPDAQHDVAFASKRIGAVLGVTGNRKEALEWYNKALVIEEKSAAAHPDDMDLQLNLTFTQSDKALMQAGLGQQQEALQEYRSVLALRQKIVDRDPADARAQGALATTHNRVGNLLREIGDVQGALDHLQLAARLLRTSSRPLPALTTTLANTEENMGDVLDQMKRHSEALSHWRAGREIYMQVARERRLTPVDERNLAELNAHLKQ